jgi:hypothetical protein
VLLLPALAGGVRWTARGRNGRVGSCGASRVDEAAEEVDQGVEGDEHQAEGEGGALHHGDVAGKDRVDDEADEERSLGGIADRDVERDADGAPLVLERGGDQR